MSESSPQKQRYLVPALVQGLSILDLFSKSTPKYTATEISQKLALPRATTYRLLGTLEEMRYLQHTEDGRYYQLGPALLNRGFEYLATLDVIDLAHPILRKLRDDTSMSSHMAVRDGNRVVYVSRFPASTTIQSSVQVGTQFPLHATIMGRMLALDLTQDELHKLFPEEPLPTFTPSTPQTVADFMTLLEADRARGYAISESFFEHGVHAVAAPIRNASGQVVAAINVTDVDAFIEQERLSGPVKDRVLEAVQEIERWLPRDVGNQRFVKKREHSQSGTASWSRRSEDAA